MRFLVAGVLALAVLWGGWWFIGSNAEGHAARAFFAAQKAQGRTADYSSLSVVGFPSRFDLTVNDIALGDPQTGVTWRAPFAQLLALSYNPYHFVVALPHSQTLETPAGRFTIASTRMEGSVTFVPGVAFALNEVVGIVDRPTLTASLGWQVGADKMSLASRRVPGRKTAQEIGLRIEGVRPDAALRARLDPAGIRPDAIREVYLDAELDFDRVIDRHALNAPPRPTGITVKDGHIAWGKMVLSVTGQVSIGATGVPDGKIDLRVQNWEGLPQILAGLGVIKQDLAPTVHNMLTELAKGSKDPNVIDLPLYFAKGWMSLGPLPLGPAPRIGG
ncbi:MAG: DUF2125 domain-containing protein [Paracoccaceae bacterium]|nr:DUF2125 domain-containing protein [Paracoccaceae bacterium]